MNILMPQLGETVAEGKITKWFKAAGDTVKPGDNLFEIETDKTSMEVPATSAGTLTQILFQVGETAKVGAVVAVISDGASGNVSVERESPAPSPLIPAQAGIQNRALGPRFRGDERDLMRAAPTRLAALDPFNEVRSPERNFGPARLPGGVTVTPLARRLAGENGIDLSKVKGSGPHGRIVARDVEQASAGLRRPDPMLGEQAISLISLRADVEVGALLKIRDEANAARPDSPIAISDFIIKAWALSLQRVPAANVTFAEGRIHQFNQSDITVARPSGALALVLKAEQKSVGAIADEIRDRDSHASEANGGSTTVVVLDGTSIRDISISVASPQATLLAIGSVRRQAVEAPENSVRFESMITATLSCDRRVVDAAAAAQLLGAFKGFMEKPVTMLV